ncbi:MAG: hypothetical protein RXQ72_05370 [Hydrogenobaculum sp.]|jgi:hypothetical protein
MKDSCSMLVSCLESFFDELKSSPFDKSLLDLKMNFAKNINIIIMSAKSNGNLEYVLCQNIDGFREYLLLNMPNLKDNCQRFKLLKALEEVIDKYMHSKDIKDKNSISTLGETIFTLLQQTKPCKK